MVSQRLTILLAVILLFRNVQAITKCHREGTFVKVDAEGLPTIITPLKTITSAKRWFCSQECLVFSGCKSLIYKKNEQTDNCILSSSASGEKLGVNDEAEILVKDNDVPKVCGDSPCQNGGTCTDNCYEPYYTCVCPEPYVGKRCEFTVSCNNVNWNIAISSSQSVGCSRSGDYLVGLYRTKSNLIDGLAQGVCCLAPTHDEQVCYSQKWGISNAWNECNEGYFVAGFNAGSGCGDLHHLTPANCCKPKTAPFSYADCYTEEFGLTFDNAYTTVQCNRPMYFIVGMRIACQQISCIDEFRCCKLV